MSARQAKHSKGNLKKTICRKEFLRCRRPRGRFCPTLTWLTGMFRYDFFTSAAWPTGMFRYKFFTSAVWPTEMFRYKFFLPARHDRQGCSGTTLFYQRGMTDRDVQVQLCFTSVAWPTGMFRYNFFTRVAWPTGMFRYNFFTSVTWPSIHTLVTIWTNTQESKY